MLDGAWWRPPWVGAADDGPVRVVVARGLALAHAVDLAVVAASPTRFGDEHLDHLGVPRWVRPWFPVVKGTAVVALLATAKRPQLRSIVGAGLVAYYSAAVAFHVLSDDPPEEALAAAWFGANAAALV